MKQEIAEKTQYDQQKGELMMKKFNVIAVNGGPIEEIVERLIKLRGYMEPVVDKIEVDEESKLVHYNNHVYPFVEYRSGIHGQATVIAFDFHGKKMEVYTDTPTGPRVTREQIMVDLVRRRNDPNSGY